MRNGRQWRLTDFQSLMAGAIIVSSVFLSGMAIGLDSIALGLLTVLIMIGSGIALYLIGLRTTAATYERQSGYVLKVSTRPTSTVIVARCVLVLQVEDTTGRRVTVRLRDSAAPVEKWPRVGHALPLDVDPRHPRRLKVRWELVAPRRPGDDEEPPAAPFHTSYAPGTPPPVDHADSATAPIRTGTLTSEDTKAIYRPEEPALDPVMMAELDRLESLGTFDEADPTPPARPAPAPWPPVRDSDPLGLDGLLDEPFPPPAATPTIPVPRPPGEPLPSGATAAGDGDSAAVGAMLLVSDLDRSLRFYRDSLGLSVVDSGLTSAVLSHAGGRVLLRWVADMPPVDRRVAHLYLSVPDVDATYQELRDKGVEFVHRPQLSRVDGLELRSATFRDPDGHAVAITQWCARPGDPPLD